MKIKTIGRMLTSGLAALALAGAAVVAAPPPSAEAALNCGGSLIDTIRIKNNHDTVVGRIGVYRNGTNICAVLVKAGPLYGKSSEVLLFVQGMNRPPRKTDGGGFLYQTDALTINAAYSANRCAYVVGWMWNLSGSAMFDGDGVYCV